MVILTKNETIELSSGRSIDVEITIEAHNESDYGADADGNRGINTWFIEGHSCKYDDDIELTEEEVSELEDKLENIVYENDAWDFDSASEKDEDDYDDDYDDDEEEEDED